MLLSTFLITPLYLQSCFMDYIIVQYVSNKAREMTQMDTPNICNVEGDNNRLTSSLQPMRCFQNPYLFSFWFRNCMLYTGNYLVLFYETNHSSLNTIDKVFRSNILDILMASTSKEKKYQ